MLEELWIQLQQMQAGKVFGKYAGTVVDTNDPNQMGRVKVRAPTVLAEQEVWAMPCVPYAGDGVGFYFIPPVGAGVWVEFEGGDVSRAIWAGCYWSQGQLPPDASSAEIKLIRTAKAQLRIDDSSGETVLKNDNDVSTTWDTMVTTEVSPSTLTVSADGVVTDSAPGKVDVGAAGVTINNGAFKVS